MKKNETEKTTVQKFIEDDQNFFRRFERLKDFFGVITDVQLANALGISQQAVASAKKKKSIPGTWIQKMMGLGMTIDFILHGKKNIEFKNYIHRYDDETQKKVIDKLNEEVIGLDSASIQLQSNQSLRAAIAKGIVLLAARHAQYKPENAHRQLLELFVMKDIMPEAVKKIMDYLKDLEELTASVQNHDKG
jgi:hypothetical protein